MLTIKNYELTNEADADLDAIFDYTEKNITKTKPYYIYQTSKTYFLSYVNNQI
ncbi:hypothetical protein [Polaribacter atrinae]|uniref:hypothetical protein n=1 Tax=Polaribacter atrinae TaxID=1333662 RepID=UPI000A45D3CC|nr:hypothetical protein [Polaribacter atrinae]